MGKKKKSSVLIEVKEACVGVGKRVAMETHAGKVEKGGLHMRETGSGGFCLEATHDDIITGLTSIDQWCLSIKSKINQLVLYFLECHFIYFTDFKIYRFF